MEGLLGMYASDEDEEGEHEDKREEKQQTASTTSPPSSIPPPRQPTSSSSLLRTQQLLASMGTIPTRKRALGSSSSGLPALDPGFFHVSAENVYTTVLTNGQRRGLPSTTTSNNNKKFKPSSTTGAEWVRSVPHIEGNWATHVYIRVANTREVVRLAQACVENGKKRLRKVFAESEKEGMGEVGELIANDLTPEKNEDEDEDEEGGEEQERGGRGLHLSLSRTVYLRSHHIEPFVADLRTALSWARAFTVRFGGGREGERGGGFLVNDERTRSFLTVPVVEGGEERLMRLVRSVDEVLRRYRQPVYYKKPLFHLSVASVRGDVEDAWREGGAEEEEEEEENAEPEDTAVYVNRIECRIGQKLFGIPLKED